MSTRKVKIALKYASHGTDQRETISFYKEIKHQVRKFFSKKNLDFSINSFPTLIFLISSYKSQQKSNFLLLEKN